MDSLTGLCRSLGVTRDELARASYKSSYEHGLTVHTLKAFERKFPALPRIQRRWLDTIVSWHVLVGRPLINILETSFIRHCPPEWVDELRLRLEQLPDSPPIHSSQSQLEINRRLTEFASEAKHWEDACRWDKAAPLFRKAANIFGPDDHRWVWYRLQEAQMHVNQGEIREALSLWQQTRLDHDAWLLRTAHTWEPTVRAFGEATAAWAYFLIGDDKEAFKLFSLTKEAAQLGVAPGENKDDSRSMYIRACHMGARALIERNVYETYFSGHGQAKRLPPSMANECEKLFREALFWDEQMKDWAGTAFDTWYLGILHGLCGRKDEGRRYLRSARDQFRNNSDEEPGIYSHPTLTLLHLDVLDCDGNPLNYRKIEIQLRGLLEHLKLVKHPQPIADALITAVDCKLRGGAGLSHRRIRQDLADQLCAALLLHPYREHILWKTGYRLLTEAVLPEFQVDELPWYVDDLSERLKAGSAELKHLPDWGIQSGTIDQLTSTLRWLAR